MTLLALDVGTRRVGVAVGSMEVRVATPLTVISRSTPDSDAERLRAIAEKYEVEQVVVGLPRELSGEIGLQAERVMKYVDRIRALLPLSFEYFDERYSTSEALAMRREIGVSERRGRSSIDAAAAAVILQDYMNSTPRTS